MASILVRGLDESVKRQFAEQAERHGRSMEAEARDILTKGVWPAPTSAWPSYRPCRRSGERMTCPSLNVMTWRGRGRP